MIDSHAHVTDEAFTADREQVFTRAQESGVQGWIEVGTTLETSAQAVTLAQKYETVWASVGVHPHDIQNLTEHGWQEIEKLVAQPKVVAIGEVGLDNFRGEDLQMQLPVLERFAALAITKNLPVIFHVRDAVEGVGAHASLISFLQQLPESKRPQGVIHTFSGTLEQAQRYIELGLYISISGIVTFKKAGDMAEAARMLPLEKLLIETDCPYLAPEPFRGKRNEPAYVKYVAEKIAQLRQMPIAEVQQITAENTRKLFALV